MTEKTVPWWRKVLNYALGSIRSGFGLFPRVAKPESQVPEPAREDRFFDRPEPMMEVETALTDQPAIPNSVAADSAIAAEQALAPGPVSSPAPDPAMDLIDPIETKNPIIGPQAEFAALPEFVPSMTPAVATIPEPPAAPAIEQEEAEAVPPAAIAFQPAQEHELEPEPVAEPELLSEPASVSQPLLAPAIGANDLIAATPGNPDIVTEPTPAEEPVSSQHIDPIVPITAPSAEPAEPESEPPASTAPAPEPATVDAAKPAESPEPSLPQAPPSKPPVKIQSRDNQADLSPFSVIVDQVYDGPLDLLLDLIRKQDIDIYDIPISKITAQFLAYVNQLKATDVDVAGEFIYTASLLIHIKSKMLLPRSPSGPQEEAEDPRRELVERLLEHERFKNAAQMLQQKQMLEAATWTNPGFREFKDDEAAEPEIVADTVDLVRVFRDILERARNRPVIDLEEDSVTVVQMIQFLARRLTLEDKPVALRRLLSHTHSERALIAMFLALLELVRLQAVLLRQDRAFSEIFIKKHTGFDTVMNEGLANTLDDWR